MKPRFSCVVPVKGKRPFLAAALESLRTQGLDDSELEIIVQDADVEPDAGQSDALNRGFAKAHGEWFFWLNADDLLLPGALKRVADLIERYTTSYSASLCWIAGNELFIDADGKRVGCSIGCGWYDWLFRHAVPHVNGPSAFFRRELFERVGGFDTSLDFCMDWDLWIRFMKSGAKYVRINDFLWAQRRWTGSKTQRVKSVSEETEQLAEIARMLEKNHLTLTRIGTWSMRLWKLLSGCFWRELLTVGLAASWQSRIRVRRGPIE